MKEKKKFDIQDLYGRLKQPHVLLMIATLLYQGLEKLGYGVDQQIFQNTVDIVTFLLFGIMIYKSDRNKFI